MGRQGDVRSERPWSRQVPGCNYVLLCTSQDATFVVTNSLVCSDCKRVTSLVASYIEFLVCT